MTTTGKKYFGVDTNTGVLSICKAKPENRGKGNCHHTEHIEMNENFTNKDLQKYNEKKLEEYYNNSSINKNKIIPSQPVPFDITPNNIKTTSINKNLSNKQFNNTVISVSNNINNDDYKIIRRFCEKYNQRISNDKFNNLYGSMSKNIKSFLESDDEVAIQTREFLGEDIDLDNFSNLISRNVGSMTLSLKWHNSKKPQRIKRIFLTSFKNDMNRERYVASVMFFGGRCCYCNQILKGTSDSQKVFNNTATGEHITPIVPDNPNSIVGATRYGNMALACFSCNHKRGSEDLEDWVEKTNRIPQEYKNAVLNRINAFREFALYDEFSQEESNIIKSEIEKTEQYISKFNKNTNSSTPYSKEDAEKISNFIIVKMHELKSKIN